MKNTWVQNNDNDNKYKVLLFKVNHLKKFFDEQSRFKI